jgi:anti-sigma B factor antagonist
MEHPPWRRFAREDEPPSDHHLTVSSEIDRGRAWLRLAGECDVENVTQLRELVREIERLRPHTLVFDLRALNFIDSSGISELLVARRRGERVGRRVLLATTPGTPVARVLAMTGIDAVMEHVEGVPRDSM